MEEILLESNPVADIVEEILIDPLEVPVASEVPLETNPIAELSVPPVIEEEPCFVGDYPHRMNASHIEARGIGYDEGYTSLEGFFTGGTDKFIPFFDMRAHVFNDGKWASNIGLGSRYIIHPARYMLGTNFYYDYRHTKFFHYNQIGLGLEAFLSRWELRANGYLPIGKKFRISREVEGSFIGFSGHNIVLHENCTQKLETAMRGFNAEIGAHLFEPTASYDLFVGAGPYYFNASRGRTTWGGKVRMKAEIARHLYVEASYSYDHVFRSRLQGTVTFSFPFGSKKCYRTQKATGFQDNLMYWRAVQPVERQEIIVTKKHTSNCTGNRAAIDPATGEPIYIVFGDNQASLVGADGTVEHPYPHFSSADGPGNVEDNSAPGNVLYIFAGDGTAFGMDQGNFQMKDGQRLLGSALAHTFRSTDGLITVPAQTTLIPHIATTATTSSDAVVLLANRNEISGFDIAALTPMSLAVGVVAPPGPPLNNTNINHNNFTGGTAGIALFMMGGTVDITDNTSSFHDATNGLGFVVQAQPGSSILIANNVVSDEKVGIIVQNLTTSVGADIQACLLNNQISNISMTGTGLAYIQNGLTTATAIVRGNTVTTTGEGIRTQTFPPSSNATFIVEDNTVTNASAFAINIFNSAPVTICTRFTGNTAITSAIDFQLDNSSGGVFQLETGGVNSGTTTYIPSFAFFTSVTPNFCGEEGGCP